VAPRILPVGYAEYDVAAPAPMEASASADASATGPEAGGNGCDACDGGCWHDRWYIGFSGGWQQREIVHEASDSRTFIEFDSGFLVNTALGCRFENFRLEAEYTFMNNECSRAGAAGFSSATTGNVNLRAWMFNAYHDFDMGCTCWKPYVGAGIGIYQSELNSLLPDFFQTLGAPFANVPINSTSNMPFAYQFRAGATRPLGERTEFYTGYRFFRGEELTFSSAPFSSFAPTFHPDGATIHAVEFGLRVKF
jgi:opacity protein-like surface antigen